jgi:Bacterial Ig domain
MLPLYNVAFHEYKGKITMKGLLVRTLIYSPRMFMSTVVLVLLAACSAPDSLAIPKNARPTANDQTVLLEVDASGQLTITLTASDPDVDVLEYIITQVPNYGTLSGTAPVLTYTPTPGYNGTDSLIYKVSDGELESALATVLIEVKTKLPPTDTTNPECTVEETTKGSLYVLTHDPESGLANIKVVLVSNADVTIEPFAPGSTAPIMVRAEKIDLAQKARLELEVIDVAGNITRCDPIIVNLAIAPGNTWGRSSVNITDIPDIEGQIRIDNGVPGASLVRIKVNDAATNTFNLSDGAKAQHDATSDMKAGSNSAVVVMHGAPGSSVMVMFHDGSASLSTPSLSTPSLSAVRSLPYQTIKTRANLDWY